MKGRVLGFNAESAEGVIVGEGDQRYAFSQSQWMSPERPEPGMEVDFVAEGKAAGEVYVVSASAAVLTPNTAVVGQNTQAEPTISALAVASLVAGIAGLLFFGSIIAIVCGHVARSQIKQGNGRLTGDGLALGGLITGYLGIALWALWFLFMGVFALIAASSGP